MNKKFKLTDKVTKESIRSPEFKRLLKVVLAAVCIFSLIFQLSTCVFNGLKVSAAFPGDTVEIDILPSLPSIAITDMDAVFESNGSTYYGISISLTGITYYTSSDLPVSVYSDLIWSDQSYRTVIITEMSPSALSWVTHNSTVLDSNYMTLKAGTYRFNDVLNDVRGNDGSGNPGLYSGDFRFTTSVNLNPDIVYGLDNEIILSCSSLYGDGLYDNATLRYTVDSIYPESLDVDGSSYDLTQYFVGHNFYAYSVTDGWVDDGLYIMSQSITIPDQFVEDSFGTWFIANTNYNEVNAPPPPEDVHDFTNEIRQFNEELTLYVTDSAEWSESFSFEFDVMGFGYSDTLYLQRGGANVYSMSYDFDIDGVFSPWQVYRYGYSTQSGGFLYQNARLVRFITNPDDTEFQQWLLDNTTLVATVDDAPTFDSIYETGFNVGYNAGYEQGFANSLIGDSLSGPINALSSITLIQIGDVEITLGGVVMTAIALCLVLAFLKIYAGG